jgi:hypothetical protein
MLVICPHLMRNHISKIVFLIVDFMILWKVTVRKVHIVFWRYVFCLVEGHGQEGPHSFLEVCFLFGYLTNSHLPYANI